MIIMLMVLFYRRGIMGDKEFSLEAIRNFFRRKFGKGKEAKGESGFSFGEDGLDRAGNSAFGGCL